MAKKERAQQSSDAPKTLQMPMGTSIAKTVTEMWRNPRFRAYHDGEITQLVFTFTPKAITVCFERRRSAWVWLPLL